MVFTKGNTFGGKKKDTSFTDAVIADKLNNGAEVVYAKDHHCGTCKKKLTGPMAHLIDMCIECVEKKQPGGVFAPPQKYISGTTIKK